jgi:hypothetical protein
MADRRWELLEVARPRLVAAFSDRGVAKVDFIANFDHWDRFSVWLCTVTDDERDALGNSAAIDLVRSILVGSGFQPGEVADVVTVAQSQETVDRDYESSWFYAMR